MYLNIPIYFCEWEHETDFKMVLWEQKHRENQA
jgi:hypothetical protein